MSNIVNSFHPAVKELLKALNLDDKDVCALTLIIKPNEAVAIKAEMFVREDQLREVSWVLKEFTLVEKEEIAPRTIPPFATGGYIENPKYFKLIKE